MNNLFIHIGSPKTGSTAIQKYLFNNKDNLFNNGIMYPDLSLRGFGHHDLAFLLNGGFPDWAKSSSITLENIGHMYLQEMNNFTGDVIISSENFYLFPNPVGLKEFLNQNNILDRFQVKIIVYIRRQDIVHESWYNQTVKAQGNADTFNHSVNEYYDLWDYERQLSLWSSVFGKESIIVSVYDEKDEDVISNFFHLLDLPALPTGPLPGRVNSGLNKDILEFQRMLNTLPVDILLKRSFHKELIELSELTSSTELFNNTPLLGTRARKKIIHSYSKSNKAVSENYFNKENLFDISDIEEKGESSEVNLDIQKVIQILGWLLLKINHRN